VAQDLDLTRGDTGKWDITVSGAVSNFGAAVFRWYAKLQKADPDSSAVIRKDSAGLGGIVIVDAGNQTLRLTVPPADSSSIVDDTYLYHDLQMTESGGDVTTLADGRILISRDVTRAA
jgi:hypothetical protein